MSIHIPKNFSAAVLVKPGENLRILNDLIIPKLMPGQVLVKMYYSGLCRSQLMEINGDRGKDIFLPHMLGHEGSGKVVKIGSHVNKVKVGDNVILSWIKSEGIETGGMKFKTESGNIVNAGPITTFSNYTIVAENRVVKYEKNISKKMAVLYGCAIPTGAGTILNEIKLKSNSTIAVIGLGGVGLSAFVTASIFKPKQLIAIDIENDKLKLAKKIGSTLSLNVNHDNINKKISEITKNQGLDFVIEAAGLTSTIELGFKLIKRFGGELIFASHPKKGNLISIDPYELISGKVIKGTWGGAFNFQRDLKKLQNLFVKHKISLKYYVKKEYSLEEINIAVRDLNERKLVRAIIKY